MRGLKADKRNITSEIEREMREIGVEMRIDKDKGRKEEWI